MPTNKQRCMITVDDDLFKQIEDYRFDNRFYTRSDAILSLIKIGLEEILSSEDRNEDSKKQREKV